VRVGDGAARIVAFGEQQQVDLVVLGTRGRSALTRTVLGSVARDVAAGTSASVLIVRTARSA
jgi:nucleotide-binding universal stress UspA family protein